VINKNTLILVCYVALLTAANLYQWSAVVQGGSAPRSGKIVGLIIMLAIGAIFADKFNSNQYAPGFIRVGSLIGMTVLFLILYKEPYS